MKITCLIILSLTALTLQPAPAAETNSAPATINEQLRDIDLKLALERYEKLQRQLFELRTEIALLRPLGFSNTANPAIPAIAA